jgi:hypothetical protein
LRHRTDDLATRPTTRTACGPFPRGEFKIMLSTIVSNAVQFSSTKPTPQITFSSAEIEIACTNKTPSFLVISGEATSTFGDSK